MPNMKTGRIHPLIRLMLRIEAAPPFPYHELKSPALLTTDLRGPAPCIVALKNEYRKARAQKKAFSLRPSEKFATANSNGKFQ